MSTHHSPLLETESETKLRQWRRDPERGMPGKKLPPHRATPVGWSLLWFAVLPLVMVAVLFFASQSFHRPQVAHPLRQPTPTAPTPAPTPAP